MPKFIDITGRRVGFLTVLRRHGTANYGKVTWLCKCDCGNEKIVLGDSLRNGYPKSCGCRIGELISSGRKSHGQSGSALYKIWLGIKKRCFDSKSNIYNHYGGRGITVCDRWLRGDGTVTGYECFAADMGDRPSDKHSIDRIDFNGNYSPENCRWATREEQMQNRRNNLNYVFNGEVLCLAEISRRVGIPYGTLKHRRRKGWEPSMIAPGIERAA